MSAINKIDIFRAWKGAELTEKRGSPVPVALHIGQAYCCPRCGDPWCVLLLLFCDGESIFLGEFQIPGDWFSRIV